MITQLKEVLGMLKKLVSALALTSLAFGSGLCFNPYNHDYGVNARNIPGYGVQYPPQWGHPFYAPSKEIILHNGKMQLDHYPRDVLKLIKYVVKGNKALVLMETKDPVQNDLLFYVKCVNGKPETKAVEDEGVADHELIAEQRMGFYKNGFFFKYLDLVWGPIHFDCGYETFYYPYKLIKEHKTNNMPPKYKSLPTRVCNALGKKLDGP
jgi:hypothetical protein